MKLKSFEIFTVKDIKNKLKLKNNQSYNNIINRTLKQLEKLGVIENLGKIKIYNELGRYYKINSFKKLPPNYN